MRKKIVIAEYISTGKNLIDDVLSRGYEPVLLEGVYPAVSEDMKAIRDERDSINARLAGKFRVIKENPDYNAVLEEVRKVDPILVIAGSEFGVDLAARLSEDLGLPGNPASRIPYMTQKDKMHEALRDYGIRHIRGKLVSSAEEALSFCEELGTENIVVKPARGAGTQGVYLCGSRDEILSAVSRNLSSGNSTLIQERINGTEYIVNTVSCSGKHRLTSIWVYDKVRLTNGTNAYNNVMPVGELEPGHWELVSYAYDVADAIGIKYGAVHGEYMIDGKGPVLVEVNCRPMGGGMSRKFVERIFGHHETDAALDSYLDPEKFEEERRKPYRIHSFGAIKIIIVPEDTAERSTPIIPLSRRMRSYYSANFTGAGQRAGLPGTRNVETAGGMIYLLHEDEKVVRADCNLLHDIEMKHPDFMFQNDAPAPSKPAETLTVGEIMSETGCRGSTLILSDSPCEAEGACVVEADELQSAYDSFEQGIIFLHEPESFADTESLAGKVYALVGKIIRGGRVIVPESTYCNMPYGLKGVEILLRAAGLRIEAPVSGRAKTLTTSKV